jgi:BirA family biotin operon repressor/biotin-[acetyl-CoA-carboxylase] ligase
MDNYFNLNNLEFFEFETLESTNDFLLKQKLNNKIQVCITKEQTKGRGQFDRQWLAPKNSSIFCSIKLKFNKEISLNGLSLIIGLSIVKTLERQYQISNLKLKWPNDIYYQDKKLAGILLENQFQKAHFVTLGFGLNFNLPSDFLPNINWIDLSQITNETINQQILTIQIIEQILSNCLMFKEQGFLYFLEDWHSYDYLKNTTKTIGNQTGIVQGVNKEGALILEVAGKQHTFYTNDR